MRRPIGMIKVNNDIIIKNAPVDKKFWDIYLKCCANQASMSDVETVRIVRRSTFGYHIYFDTIDMTATVISFKIRIVKQNYEDSKAETHEAIQQLIGGRTPDEDEKSKTGQYLPVCTVDNPFNRISLNRIHCDA